MAISMRRRAINEILRSHGAALEEAQAKIDDLDDPKWVEKWVAKQRNKLSLKRSELESYIQIISATNEAALRWERDTQLDLPLHDEETGEVDLAVARAARKLRDDIAHSDGIDSVTFTAGGKSVKLEGRRRSAEPEKLPAAG